MEHVETLELRTVSTSLHRNLQSWVESLAAAAQVLDGKLDALAADNAHQAEQLRQRDAIIAAKDEEIDTLEKRVAQRDDAILALQTEAKTE